MLELDLHLLVNTNNGISIKSKWIHIDTSDETEFYEPL